VTHQRPLTRSRNSRERCTTGAAAARVG